MADSPRHRVRDREPPGPEAALELAAHYLAARPRSRWEVERRLRRAAAPPDVIEATLERLEGLRFVDDMAFARWWVEQRDRHAPRGRRAVEAELRQHGVGREVIETMREEESSGQQSLDATWSADDRPPRTDEARAEAALAQHLRGRPMPEDPKSLQRLAMFLVRRGFDPEMARRTLRTAEAGRTSTGPAPEGAAPADPAPED